MIKLLNKILAKEKKSFFNFDGEKLDEQELVEKLTNG